MSYEWYANLVPRLEPPDLHRTVDPSPDLQYWWLPHEARRIACPDPPSFTFNPKIHSKAMIFKKLGNVM